MGSSRSQKVFVVALLWLGLRGVLVYTGAGSGVVSTLVGIGADLLVAIACLEAAFRSGRFAKQFWSLIAMGFLLAASAEAIFSWYEKILKEPLTVAWPTTVFFFLVGTPWALALLLDERAEPGPVRWEQALDLAQVGIVATAGYLLFVYAPSLGVSSVSGLAAQALSLHFLRDGFLLAAFAVRSADARTRVARRLYSQGAIFFLIYGAVSALYFYGLGVLHLGLDSWVELPVTGALVVMVWLATRWKDPVDDGAEAKRAGRRRILPVQFVPLVFPLVVLVLASRIAQEQLAVAWVAVGASFACAAVRLAMTQRKQVAATRALRQSETRFRTLVENMAEVVYTADREGTLTYISPAVQRVLGYAPEDVLGRKIHEFVLPEERDAIQRMLEERLSGKAGGEERRALNKNGQPRWVYAVSYPVEEHGAIVGVTGVFMDITAHKASEERFRKVFQSSPSAMSISRLKDGCYIDVNERWSDLTGFSRAETLGRTSVELGFWTQEERAQFLEKLERDHNVRDFEHRLRFPKGGQRSIVMSAELVDFEGEPCVLAASQDVTQVRQMEEQLRQKQKMEAIGALAGGVAHDFNNVLTVIKGYGELLQDSLRQNPGLYEQITQIREAAERAASLTRQLLAFSRQQVLQAQVIQLNSTISNLEKMLRRLIGEDVALVTRCAPGLWNIKADPGQVEQVVMNLVVNARDAMPEGGKLEVETGNVQVGEEERVKHPIMVPGPYVKLTVTDHGVGMDAETRRRIFEPFFTTKKAGEGTGLGLATVYGIVKQSQGFIWVESEPGKGSTFEVYFPQAVAREAADAAKAVHREEARGTETILLVEDDEGVRRLAATVLAAHGYNVLQARNGREADQLSRSHPEKLDLLVTDLVMPEINGREVAARIRHQRPDIPVVFISGYSRETHAFGGAPQDGETIVQKPFTPAALADTVRQVLDAASATGRVQ